MMVVAEAESDGQKSVHQDHDHNHDQDQDQGSDEKCRRHPRWTREETLSLIQAKQITENSPYRGRKMSSVATSAVGVENTEPKWVTISSNCRRKGVNRGPAQCRKRWSNLIGDFKKVKAWEEKLLTDKSDSFWVMRNDLRKERKLPVSFDREVFRVLEGREGDSLSPLPLQALFTGVPGDDSEEEEPQEETEPKSEEPKGMINAEDVLEIENLPVSEFTGEKQGEEDAPVLGQKLEEDKSPTGYVAKSPVTDFCSPDPDPDPISGAFRESWPGISYWDSQERAKRQRLSPDGNQVNDMETQIIRILETNNKTIHAQLDFHKKNNQLDREQRKENSDALVAALDKLSDAIVKIAEKL